MREIYSLADFDLCKCGDYRNQHKNGIGCCRMDDGISHGLQPCLTFRLSIEAKELPEWTKGEKDA